MSNGDSITIVSCGTMRDALERLKDEGLLDGIDLLFPDVCLKERPWELERQLKEKLHEAGDRSDKLLVVYGNRCSAGCWNPSAVSHRRSSKLTIGSGKPGKTQMDSSNRASDKPGAVHPTSTPPIN